MTCSIVLPASRDDANIAHADGKTLADLFPSGWFFRYTGFTTDGSSLYAVGVKQEADGQGPFTDFGLFRTHPQTLKVAAFVDYPIADPSTTLPTGFLLSLVPPS